MATKTISFEKWAKTLARARGPAAAEIMKLRESFPTYKDVKSYATKYPLAHRNFLNYCRRGSRAAA